MKTGEGGEGIYDFRYSPPPYLGDFVRDGMALLTRYSVRWRIIFPRRQNPHLGDFFRDGTANIYDIASPFRAAILYTPFFTTKKSFFFFTDGTLLFQFFWMCIPQLGDFLRDGVVGRARTIQS